MYWLRPRPSSSGGALSDAYAQLPPAITKIIEDRGYVVVAVYTATDAHPEDAGELDATEVLGKGQDPLGVCYTDSDEIVLAEHIDYVPGRDTGAGVWLWPIAQRLGLGDRLFDLFARKFVADPLAHEIGHAFDNLLGGFSSSKEFLDSYRLEARTAAAADGYFLQDVNGPEETFAELFGEAVARKPGDNLKESFPKTYKLVAAVENAYASGRKPDAAIAKPGSASR